MNSNSMNYSIHIENIKNAELLYKKIYYYKHILDSSTCMKYTKLITNDTFKNISNLKHVIKSIINVEKNISKLSPYMFDYEYLLENIDDLFIFFTNITTNLSFISGFIHNKCQKYIEESGFFDENENFIFNDLILTKNDKIMIQMVIFEWKLDFMNYYFCKLYIILEKIKNVHNLNNLITLIYHINRKDESIKNCKKIKNEIFEITYEYDYMIKNILSEDEKNELKNNFKL